MNIEEIMYVYQFGPGCVLPAKAIDDKKRNSKSKLQPFVVRIHELKIAGYSFDAIVERLGINFAPSTVQRFYLKTFEL